MEFRTVIQPRLARPFNFAYGGPVVDASKSSIYDESDEAILYFLMRFDARKIAKLTRKFRITFLYIRHVLGKILFHLRFNLQVSHIFFSRQHWCFHFRYPRVMTKMKTLWRVTVAIYPRRQLARNVIHGAIIFDTRYTTTCRQPWDGRRYNHFLRAFRKDGIFPKGTTHP